MNNLPKKPTPTPRKPELEFILKRKRSPVPWLVTVGFIGAYGVYAVFAALTSWIHIPIAIVSAMLIYTVTKRMFPPVEVKIPRRAALPPSGSGEADKLLGSGEDHLKNAEVSKSPHSTAVLPTRLRPCWHAGIKLTPMWRKIPKSARTCADTTIIICPSLISCCAHI